MTTSPQRALHDFEIQNTHKTNEVVQEASTTTRAKIVGGNLPVLPKTQTLEVVLEQRGGKEMHRRDKRGKGSGGYC